MPKISSIALVLLLGCCFSRTARRQQSEQQPKLQSPVVASIAPFAHAQRPTAEVIANAKRIATSILLTSQGVESLRKLADMHGSRLAGSPGYDRAAEWAAAKFRSYGITDVRLERFTVPNGWERGWANGRIVEPITRHLTIQSVGWSPATPPGGINAPVVIATDLSPEGIRRRAGEFSGKVVMVDWPGVRSRVSAKVAVRQLQASYEVFRGIGGVAVLLSGIWQKNNVLDWTDVESGARVLALPVAEVGMEDGKLIHRLSEHGAVRIAFEFQNQVSGPTATSNVIAEIPGEQRDQWIIVGAHLDDWDFGTGAQDDGTGVLMVLEAARAISGLGVPPKRSMRFALWGAEEPGPSLGSHMYVQAHSAELANCVAALNTDHGAGHPQGWKVYRQDLVESMAPISASLLRDLGGDQLSTEMHFDGDSGSFFYAGVPTLELMVDTAGYSDIVHKQGDSFDKVDPVFFKLDAAIVAITAFAIAENPDPIGRHLRKDEIDELLKKASLPEPL